MKKGLICFFIISFLITACGAPGPQTVNWDAAGGNEGQTKYSGLSQINTKNVHQLKQAWVYHSGNPAGNIQRSPLVIDDVMYVTTPEHHLVAVDAMGIAPAGCSYSIDRGSFQETFNPGFFGTFLFRSQYFS